MKRKFSQTYAYALQLEQIRRHRPDLYTEISEIISGAIANVAKQLQPSVGNYIDNIQSLLPLFWEVATTNTPPPGKELSLAQTDYGRVTIHRLSRDNKLRLILRGSGKYITSNPLARWGFDETHISGRGGCWKWVDGAEGLFQEWLREVVG